MQSIYYYCEVKMKLLLVYPEIESSNTNTSTYSLPLGLGSIATYCKRNFRDSLEIKILDGSLVAHEEQLEVVRQYKPDLTGINSTIASQKNAYEIGLTAKELGSRVMFGGVNSTNLWQNMLKNRNFIDGVVLYDGEIPMQLILTKLVGNDSFKGIPNLAYRDSEGEIHEPPIIYIPALSELSNIDYSLFDLQRFFEQTQKRRFGKALTYYAGKGCAKRGGLSLKQSYSLMEYNQLVNSMDVCTFCGRNELGLRNLDEDREAEIVRSLHDQYGVTGFFNVQDTVNLRNSSPIGLNDSWFRLFIGTESITPEHVRKLKQRYGPNLIFQAGVEAATPQMRQVYGKKVTDLEELTSKVELMKDEGIQLHASFILGGIGETKEMMRKTTEAAKLLAGYDNVTWILISPQLILPGSPDYKALLTRPKMHKKYSGQDLIDIAEINQDFLRHFTPDLTRQEIIDEIKRTFEDIRKKDRKDLVLDVKGVIDKEEEYIKPNRPYAETY
jgi:anaerobic magnesium-protoporphyrin IX monomethyl ester cyclase